MTERESRASLVLVLALGVSFAACKRGGAEPSQGAESGRAVNAAQASATSAGTEADFADRMEDAPARVETDDDGIFSEYDERVRLRFPNRLESAAVVGLTSAGSESTFAFVGGTSVGLVPEDFDPVVEVDDWGDSDIDGDGIPNQVDILLGAKKAVINGADYQGGYQSLEYPGGDVPRTEGVCTDVIVRTLRNAGIDLQKRLHEDIEGHGEAYPMVETPDPNIDQRRVRTILPYFERHWESLSTDPDAEGDRWLPGDLVFMNTMHDERPDHVGIISDRKGESGHPLVINNWTNGYETSAMDLLGGVPVTHRFRLAGDGPEIPEEHRGLEGLLKRRGFDLPAGTNQVLAVTTEDWNRSHGVLRRYEKEGDQWERVGKSVEVRLGRAGLGWGRGLHDSPHESERFAPTKEEGDLRAPAGMFSLGAAFGPSEKPPVETNWEWRRVTSDDYFVDDPESEHYNEWIRLKEGEAKSWESAERLSMYELGVVVEHNIESTVNGAGSAIFLHTFGGEEAATLGCTAMGEGELQDVVAWLEPGAEPVLVQVVAVEW